MSARKKEHAVRLQSSATEEIMSGYNLATACTTSPNGKKEAVLKDGCYLIRYVPAQLVEDTAFFEGTLRVMRVMPDGRGAGTNDHDSIQAEIKAGADLYARPRLDMNLSKSDPKESALRDPSRWEKDPDKDASSIPIFPRALYHYYLEVTKVLENTPVAGEVSVFLSIYEFNQNTEWSNPGTRLACLQKVHASQPYKGYFSGNVLDQDSGEIVGVLTLCRISDYLRRATVAIHRVKGVKFSPGDNLPTQGPNAEAAWKEAFRETGWRINLDIRERPDLHPLDKSNTWTTSELQQALHALHLRTEPALIRKAQKQIPGLSTYPDPLDHEWLYHLLCVPRIDGFDRGVMFDTYGSDSENLPREGAAVAAEWKFGDDAKPFLKQGTADKAKAEEIKERWEPEDGKQLQAVAKVYFRVAVHEIGHAMGLEHNFQDHGFMNTTDSIADDELTAEKCALESNLESILLQSLPADSKILQEAKRLGKIPGHFDHVAPFPGFIKLRFQADDLNRLRFGPDVAVRPGTSFSDPGPLFGDAGSTPADGLQLEASPLLNSVPFGAPVRIKLKITNTSNQPQQVPFSLSLKGGLIDGSVVDPNGTERAFWPLKRWEDSDPGGYLAPGKSTTYAVTLLRGPQKALFPMAGSHRLTVRATWQRGADSLRLESAATVRVTPPVDDKHRTAALKVISTPDTLLCLALVGDQFKEGTAAIRTAMANPILKPHFALIHAKLLLSGPNTIDPDAACNLIEDSVVMSFDEIESLGDLMAKACKAKTISEEKTLQRAVKCLQDRIRALRDQGVVETGRAASAIQRLCDLLKSWTAPQKMGKRVDPLIALTSSAKEKQPPPGGFEVEFTTSK